MLCLLAFTQAANGADVLMLSAMMSNAEDIAAWVGSLVDRQCLALSFDWRPTRQARGCVVYDAGRIGQLTRQGCSVLRA